MGFFSKILGTHSQRELKRIYPLVDKIEALSPVMEKLTDEELKNKTTIFKQRLEQEKLWMIFLWKPLRLFVRQRAEFLG